MANRTRLHLYVSITSAIVGMAGCSYSQQSKFQNSFLPAAVHPVALAAGVDVNGPPVVQPNVFLQEPPKFLSTLAQAGPAASRGDNLLPRVEQHFQKAKKYYQAKDAENARREFDIAIDLMLEASDAQLADRQGYEKRLDEMVDAVHRYDMAGLGSSTNIDDSQFAQFEKAPLEDILQMTFPVDPKLKNRVREQVQATASQLPLSVNDAVLGYINYFMGHGRRTLINGLERSGRYGQMIHDVLSEEGIPQELIHLAQAESGFSPHAMSYKAAGGMWQFVVWRGQQYGLKQTEFTDDRFDPEKATRAAAHHLHDLYNEFGDWYLAIAAYNCGPVAVEKAVERTGYADFWELRARGALPAETTNYVPIILAMTIMDKNAKEYGVDGVVPEPAIEYDTVEVNAPTHLALVGDLTDTPVSQLMELNPALLKGVAPSGYAVRVPKGMGNTLMASLQMIPAERRASWRLHTVAGGETLAGIGKRYGAAPESIVAANRLRSAEPAVGDRLIIPASFVEKSGARRTVLAGRKSVRHASGSTVRSTTASARKSTGTRASTTARRRKNPTLTRTAYNHTHPAAGN